MTVNNNNKRAQESTTGTVVSILQKISSDTISNIQYQIDKYIFLSTMDEMWSINLIYLITLIGNKVKIIQMRR